MSKNQESTNELSQLVHASERSAKKRSRRCSFLSLVIVVGVLACLCVVIGFGVGTVAHIDVLPDDPYERAVALLLEYPVIDGSVSLVKHLECP